METNRLKWSLTLVLINAVLIIYTIVSWNNISVNQSVVRSTKPSNHDGNITCQKRLPQALIIGAPKCGTAAWSTYLSFHPDIAIDKKRELFFFSENYKLGFDWYLDNLPCARPDQLVIERSSQYIEHEFAPKRVWQMDPKVKLILIVCEPVRRTISHFAMRIDHEIISNKSFEDFLFRRKNGKRTFTKSGQMLVNGSKYSLLFPKWLELFSFKQIHIVDGDKLTTEPYPEVAATERFLGLKKKIAKRGFVYNEIKHFYCYKPRPKQKLECLGKGKGRKHPDVNEHVKQYLREYLKPYNKLFFNLLKRHFDWWAAFLANLIRII